MCSPAADGGTPPGGVCVLPFGSWTTPGDYPATIAVSNPCGGAFALAAGGLLPGLIMPAQSGPGTDITGNPAQTGAFNFSVKARSPRGLTATRACQTAVTVQEPPDQLRCGPADNGGFLNSGARVLAGAAVGQLYRGHLVSGHQAGGTLGIVAGALPQGLFPPATSGASGASAGGALAQPGSESAYSFTGQGTSDQGQPPGMTLQNSTAGPRGTSNQPAGTPATAGIHTFTMRGHRLRRSAGPPSVRPHHPALSPAGTAGRRQVRPRDRTEELHLRKQPRSAKWTRLC